MRRRRRRRGLGDGLEQKDWILLGLAAVLVVGGYALTRLPEPR